ncbi:MAG: hypothetical protein M1819_004563 [Sarea resinae]|nr:MAG: hypothetical protein M1819_004563 [Sarea resinae]
MAHNAIDEKPLRVAVIGGGLAGLILGQALRTNPRIKVTVYERNKEPVDRLDGFRIIVPDEVMAAIKSAIPEDVAEHLNPSIGAQHAGGQQMYFITELGDIIFSHCPKHVLKSASVSRWKLREGLLHGMAGSLELGKHFQRYEERADGMVRAFFADQSSVECDLLVGADGLRSQVKKQLYPQAKITRTGVAVMYFKIPLTPEVEELIPYGSGGMVLGPHNHSMVLHTWKNPQKWWSSTTAKQEKLGVNESFMMIGFGGPLASFMNRTKFPEDFTSVELKEECLARVNSYPVHPKLKRLAELCLTESAYVNVIRDCEVIRPWKSKSITLIGDALFNMSPMLGKGATCAMQDALALAEVLNRPSILDESTREDTLYKTTTQIIQKRLYWRSQSRRVHNLIWFSANPILLWFRNTSMRVIDHSLDLSFITWIFLLVLLTSFAALVMRLW